MLLKIVAFLRNAHWGWLAGLSVGAFALWCLTAYHEPGPAVLVAYPAAAIAAGVLVARWAREFTASNARLLAIAGGAGLAAAVLFGWSDHYVSRSEETERGECWTYANWYGRWTGTPYYRSVLVEDSRKEVVFSGEGPVSPTRKRHGAWEYVTWNPYHREAKWYWYGEEITEEEWHLRAKK